MISDQFDCKFKIDVANELILNIPSGVFIPTGTTTVLIEAVRSYVRNPGKVLDLACGSGVVGIALYQIGLVKSPLYASDLTEEAISCTKKNSLFHHCSVTTKCGSLFDPWENEKFDYIVNDVSGISEDVAKRSPWYNGVPCDSGKDGTLLVIEVVRNAPAHLYVDGLLFFPVISFSNVGKILKSAREVFSHVERLVHKEWPLPKEMYRHLSALKRLREEGHIQFEEKFGMVFWFTDIYVAYNKEENKYGQNK